MDIKKALEMKLSRALLPDEKIEIAEGLYPGLGKGEVRKKLKAGLLKRLGLMVIALIVLLAALEIKQGKAESGLDFSRNPLNQGSSSVDLLLSVDGVEEVYRLDISESEPDDETLDRLYRAAEEILDGYILGNNPDFFHVSEKMLLPSAIIAENVKLPLSWSSDRMDILNTQGGVNSSHVETSCTVTLKAKIRMGKEFRMYERLITVLPPTLSRTEKDIKEAKEEIIRIEGERSQSDFSLPNEIKGVQIALWKKSINYPAFGILLAVVIPLAGYYSFFESLQEKRKKKIDEGLADYKDFIRKLILLLSAGMSVPLAWRKLCKDYGEKEGDSLLSGALRVSMRELDSGIREQICYRRFAERMGSRPYERLAEILSQQSVKGVAHVSTVLERELKDVCEEEKEQIRVKAERAGTELLLPIMGLLSIVFLVVLMPAFVGISI